MINLQKVFDINENLIKIRDKIRKEKILSLSYDQKYWKHVNTWCSLFPTNQSFTIHFFVKLYHKLFTAFQKKSYILKHKTAIVRKLFTCKHGLFHICNAFLILKIRYFPFKKMLNWFSKSLLIQQKVVKFFINIG